MFSVTKIRDRVYCLRVDNEYELAMMCLRVSESFEAPNPRFHKPFTIAEYMAWYAKTQSGDGHFSYTAEWSGWNIRVDEIKKVHDAGIPDPNHYDALMLGIHGLIAAETTEPSYLIAVPTKTDDPSLDIHELTHAMYYIDDEYKIGCQNLLLWLDAENGTLLKELRSRMEKAGYSYKAVDDEIQAYISTGESGYFDGITDPTLDEFRDRQKNLHAIHYSEFMKKSETDTKSI